jgi:hypothetical protein
MVHEDMIIGHARCVTLRTNLDHEDAVQYLTRHGRQMLEFTSSRATRAERLDRYHDFRCKAANRTVIIVEGVLNDFEEVIEQTYLLRHYGARYIYVLSRRIQFMDHHLDQIALSPINMFFLTDRLVGDRHVYKFWYL